MHRRKRPVAVGACRYSDAVTLEDRPPICDLPEQQWSSKQLRRLGESIRDGLPEPANGPSYSDVMLWYDDVAAAVQASLRELDWTSLLVDRPAPEISSRAKTIDTLREKLQRDRGTPLSSVQDVAGVRFECEMTLEEQDIVALAIARSFGHDATVIHDLRAQPRCGYRAVHVWLRLARGRVEVQVRTHMQSAWANAYEALADSLGRGIRYGLPPNDGTKSSRDIVKLLQSISTKNVASLERRRQRLATLQISTGLTDDVLSAAPRSRISQAAAESIQSQWAELQADEAKFVKMLRDIESVLRLSRS